MPEVSAYALVLLHLVFYITLLVSRIPMPEVSAYESYLLLYHLNHCVSTLVSRIPLCPRWVSLR